MLTWSYYLSHFSHSYFNVSHCTGCKQNGTKLGDVILPPWAKGDPREFIRVHREVMGVHLAVELGSHWVIDHSMKRGPWAMYHPFGQVTNICIIFSYFNSYCSLANFLPFWAINKCQPVTEPLLWITGFGMWLCECPSAWMDWLNLWLQTARPCRSRSCKRLPPPVLWGSSGYLQHKRPTEGDSHYRVH